MTATTERWLDMERLGATVPREALETSLAGTEAGRERVPVQTLRHARLFFRGVAYAHTPRVPIPVGSPSHAWLLWLIEGSHYYSELCPLGVEHFCVYLNSNFGHTGSDRVFGVMAVAAPGGWPREFSYVQALRGVPKAKARAKASVWVRRLRGLRS